MKVFVMHYKPLIERKKSIINLLKELKLDGQFILDFDREEIEEFYKNYDVNHSLWKKQLQLTKNVFLKNKTNKINNLKDFIKDKYQSYLSKVFTPKWMLPRKLSLSEISLTLKHLSALKQISKLNEPALIIEDDVIIKPITKELIEKAFVLCKQKYDYVDLGGGCNLPLFKNDKQIKIYENFIDLNIPRSRTTAAYMINAKAANMIAKNLTPIVMPIDWQLQYLFLKYNFRVAWAIPPAFIHGSESIFTTTIEKS